MAASTIVTATSIVTDTDVTQASPNTSTPVEEESASLYSLPLMQARFWLRRIVIPLVILSGVFGNSMMVAIVLRVRASRSIMDQYLLAVAVSDLLALVSGPLSLWLELVFGVSWVNAHDVMCKIFLWLYNSACATSAWLLVAMTTQRALSVVWPHRVNVLCTPARSRRVIVATAALFSLAYSHLLYGTGLLASRDFTDRHCTLVSEAYAAFMLEVWVYVEMWIFSFVPFAFLLLANLVLIASLRASLKEARARLGTDDSRQKARSSEAVSVSVTVVVVSMSFIFLTGPMVINNAVNILYVGGGSERTVSDLDDIALSFFLETVFYLIFYCNYALNFYLYCLTGARFRNEFKKDYALLVIIYALLEEKKGEDLTAG